MAFFSSPLPAQTPLSWGALRLSKAGWAPGDSHPMSSGSTSVYGGRLWVCPRPGFFPGESWGRGPQAMPPKWGEGDPQS